MAAAVPAEVKFVQVALDIKLAQAVKYALAPPLEVGKDAMRPDQQFMRLAGPYDAGLMAVRGRVIVAQPAVADDMGAGRNRPGDDVMPRSTSARGSGPDGSPCAESCIAPTIKSCPPGCASLSCGLPDRVSSGTESPSRQSRPAFAEGCGRDQPSPGATCRAGARRSCSCPARTAPEATAPPCH